MHRILTLLLLTSVCTAQQPAKAPADVAKVDPAMGTNAKPKIELDWHNVEEWGVEGRLWQKDERLRWFDRLPAKAQGKVTDAVWGLSRDSAGMMVRFKTDASSIHANYKVSKSKLGQPHMPATGVSGIDLYARDEKGAWRWVQVIKPDTQEITAEIIAGLAPGEREYAAYLPLYNGTEFLKIGVPKGAKFQGLAPRTEKPVIFYGTSITHGACASRPGMVHTAILGRKLDYPVVNLGFSGNGRMDTAVGDLLVQEEAAAYVIDCLPNMNAEVVAQKCVPLVKQLRAAQPTTPIVLVEDRVFTNAWITPAKAAFHQKNHAALKKAYEELLAAGITGLHYIKGDDLLGSDGEGATDASHPNDLGFMRQAEAFLPTLKKILGK